MQKVKLIEIETDIKTLYKHIHETKYNLFIYSHENNNHNINLTMYFNYMNIHTQSYSIQFRNEHSTLTIENITRITLASCPLGEVLTVYNHYPRIINKNKYVFIMR